MPKHLNNEELQRILDEEDFNESEGSNSSGDQEDWPQEDLLIEQPDGTKACLNWELRGKGYQILDLKKPRRYQ